MMLKPHPHQQWAAESLLLHRRNVILQAPTGAGKFYTALLPYLNALQNDRDFPAKCIYVVPMRILADQFYEEARSAVRRYGLKIDVTIQMGNRQQDREFEGDLIFTTIDQVLSSFLISPYSLSKRKANLNAGAILSSYLVFDEFHLFDATSTLPTTLHILQMLTGITPFLLMTATLSDDMLNQLQDRLEKKQERRVTIIPENEKQIQAIQEIQSQQKTRFYEAVRGNDDTPYPMTADTILDVHTGRSLVICNIVRRTRAVYTALCAEIMRRKLPTTVLLLHSRLLPDDRQRVENRIRDLFGKGNTKGDYIVVATQAIEVGVDMTSTALHTELAPASAVVQRAGRCARYEGETGHVYVYRWVLDDVPDDDNPVDLCEKVMPYQGQQAVFKATWNYLKELDNAAMTFEDEQSFVSTVHRDDDQNMFDDMRSKARQYHEKIRSVMRGDEGADARQLIRNIKQQLVTIHVSPDDLLADPFDYPAFGLHPGSVQGMIQSWLERREHADDIQMLCEHDDEDAAQFYETSYYWKPVEDGDEARYAPLVVVHPRLARYDDTLGFLHDEDGGWPQDVLPADSESDKTRQPGRKIYHYQKETYETHIQLVYEAFERYWPEADYAARQLEQAAEWQSGSVKKAAQLAVLLHDVGKLSITWQQWAHEYQTLLASDEGLGDVEKAPRQGEAYAHTDYKSTDFYRELEKKIYPRRPWHAVEGAYAVWDVLLDELKDNEELTGAAYSAIARHHAPFSDTHQTYQLHSDAVRHIHKAAEPFLQLHHLDSLYGLEEEISGNGSDAANFLVRPVDGYAFLAYLLIIRVLRRADSAGTEAGSH